MITGIACSELLLSTLRDSTSQGMVRGHFDNGASGASLLLHLPASEGSSGISAPDALVPSNAENYIELFRCMFKGYKNLTTGKSKISTVNYTEGTRCAIDTV